MTNAGTGNPASRLQVSGSVSQINDYFYDQGWTDGLPIVPPTEDLVLEMLEACPLPGGTCWAGYRRWTARSPLRKWP